MPSYQHGLGSARRRQPAAPAGEGEERLGTGRAATQPGEPVLQNAASRAAANSLVGEEPRGITGVLAVLLPVVAEIGAVRLDEAISRRRLGQLG